MMMKTMMSEKTAMRIPMITTNASKMQKTKENKVKILAERRLP